MFSGISIADDSRPESNVLMTRQGADPLERDLDGYDPVQASKLARFSPNTPVFAVTFSP